MKSIHTFLILFGTFLPLISTRHVDFFRRDYVYVDAFDSFYKAHWDRGSSWDLAFITCNDEEAALFYPISKDERDLVKILMKNMTVTPNVSEIFIGVHDNYNVGEFITIDGHTTPSTLHVAPPVGSELAGENCVLLNIQTGLYRVGPCVSQPYAPVPFICKKVNNKLCSTIDQGYKYVKSSNKCYKVNKRRKLWQEAMQTCFMEGGILTVLENEDEAKEIIYYLEPAITYYVGFRRTFPIGRHYTVKGQKLDDVYHYHREEDYDRKQCGAVHSDGSLYVTTRNCDDYLPFICEMGANI